MRLVSLEETPSVMRDYSEKGDVNEEVGSHQTPNLLAS